MTFRSDGLNFAIPGAPFQAEGTVSSTQILAGGSTIVRELRMTLARDADGRFSYETYAVQPAEDSVGHIILNPVAKCTYSWGTNSKVVMSHVLAETSHVTVSSLPPVQDASSHLPADKKQVKTEDLGKRTIAGIEAVGTRTLTTIPAGAIGNTEPLVLIHEIWISPELQLVLAESDENPFTGSRKSEITSLAQGAPDSHAVFQPPQGMEIKEITPFPSRMPIHLNAQSPGSIPGALGNGTLSASSSTVPAPPSLGIVQDTIRAVFAFSSVVVEKDQIKGLPIEAKGKIALEQTLANGTVIRNSYDYLSFRDEEGRKRGELTMKLPNIGTQIHIVTVWDPVDKTIKTWTTGTTNLQVMVNHLPDVGHLLPEGKQQIPASLLAAGPPSAPIHVVTRDQQPNGVPAAAPIPVPLQQGSNICTETLPKDTMAGLPVEGTRTKRTIAPGVEGNDREIIVTSETWTSADLKVKVRQMSDDPRTGKSTTELTEIKRSNPDPALFTVPEGYKVIDMTRPPAK
jgi:hypothetical protein